ncbi:V-type proton ATPase subunit E isoform X1 [Bemisia tabaci]|uniref:V-type proton ATPase subunit E isoform X1 n=1 Tax=Bemisia tabaci TaxID=7038 RepID=UPI003B27B740
MLNWRDCTFENQVHKMVGFIEQEGKERSAEILSRAEEEYNLLVGRLVQISRLNIMREYEQMDKQIAKSKIMSEEAEPFVIVSSEMSSMYSKARTAILWVRYEHVRRIVQEAKRQLVLRTETPQYRNILFQMILQSLFRMGVGCNVFIIVTEKDEAIVRGCLDDIEEEYHTQTGARCKLAISKNSLHKKEIGGVELITFDARIRARNTLRARLVQVTERMIPLIRYGLYGFNPHRKSVD